MELQHLIFSSEGFWSDTIGWSLYKDEATIYTIDDSFLPEFTKTIIFPHSKDNDSRFITFDDAETLDYDDFIEKLYIDFENVFSDKEIFINSTKNKSLSELIALFNESINFVAYETEGFEVLVVKRTL